MKITILQGAFLPVPPALGGAVEKMWFALGKEFVKNGHQVTQISRSYDNFPNEEIIEGVLHKRVPGFSTPSSGIYLKWLDFRYTLRAKKNISLDTDIVVTNTFWAPILVNSQLKKKCFIDVARLPKGQMKFYKKAGRLRANSSVVVAAIKKETTPVDWNRIVMIPNPLPFNVSSATDISDKKELLLYTGRVHPEKGMELLIEAYRSANINWKLQIIGPHAVSAGGGGEAYFEKLKKMANGLNIQFMGPVYDEEVLNIYYREASIFVYPSVAEQGETFGLAPLEAMAWGCVPIVSNLACFQDFITDGENGLIFNHRSADAVKLLANKLRKLIADQQATSALAIKAMEVSKTHSTAVIGHQFLEDFKQLAFSSNQLFS